MGQRKLQIFLSSTYEDLIDERLAAMEAILAAGHIPAAMEQFTPGDETAWEKIKRWIDESDAYILILGTRYGSLEPASGKSYVHLEYDYALEQKKPFMSLVIKDEAVEAKVKEHGLKVTERYNESKHREFKDFVKKSHCGFWMTKKDIQAEIFRKLPEWNQRPDLKGWVRAEEAASPEVMNELARLSSENHYLREQLSKSILNFDGLTFEQMVQSLRDDTNLQLERVYPDFRAALQPLPKNAGHLFDIFMDDFASEEALVVEIEGKKSLMMSYQNFPGLYKHNLIRETNNIYVSVLTDVGRKLRNQLLNYGGREKRYRELWHVPDSETPFSES